MSDKKENSKERVSGIAKIIVAIIIFTVLGAFMWGYGLDIEKWLFIAPGCCITIVGGLAMLVYPAVYSDLEKDRRQREYYRT